MTVKELIEVLTRLNQDAIVVLSKDSEGNYCSPLSDVETANYAADSPTSGEIGLIELTPDAIEHGYTEEDVIDGVPAVVLL
jgi:hypothetical protein